MKCYVYDKPIDAGATVSRVLQSVREKFTVARLKVRAVEVVERSPALFVELQYLAASPAGKRLGQLKLGVFPDVASPVFCLHDEPGYLKTFQRVATRLATILARSSPAVGPPTTYRTVSVTSLEGVPVGFDAVRYAKGEDGVRRITRPSRRCCCPAPAPSG